MGKLRKIRLDRIVEAIKQGHTCSEACFGYEHEMGKIIAHANVNETGDGADVVYVEMTDAAGGSVVFPASDIFEFSSQLVGMCEALKELAEAGQVRSH